jgi:hypothetical protein
MTSQGRIACEMRNGLRVNELAESDIKKLNPDACLRVAGV